MNYKFWLAPVTLSLVFATSAEAQTVITNAPYYPPSAFTSTSYSSTTTQSTESPPPIIYQNSLTTPPITNPSASLPGAPISPSSWGLPGLPSNSPAVLPGNSTTPQAPTLMQSIYPQGGAQPGTPQQQQPQPAYLSQQQQQPGGTFNFTPLPYEVIEPPKHYLPGIATIKDKRWITTDFLYNLSSNIGVKVEILKPQGQYIPLSESLLAQRISDLFQSSNITPSVVAMNCQPPLPMFYVSIMAYPCDRRIVGFVSAQLYEQAKPQRIEVDLNGVWQTITWERQAMVAAATNDFAHEVNEVLSQMVESFTGKFKYYHPVAERKCFPE